MGAESMQQLAAEDNGFDGLTEDDLVDDAEVDTMIRETITQVVGDSTFALSKVQQWAATIPESCLKRLVALNKPFKFVVTCNLTQQAGAGLHSACCTRWNEKTDGKLAVQWENAQVLVLLTVYWMAI